MHNISWLLKFFSGFFTKYNPGFEGWKGKEWAKKIPTISDRERIGIAEQWGLALRFLNTIF